MYTCTCTCILQVPDQQSLISTGDLSSNQFILPSHTQPSTDGTQSSGMYIVFLSCFVIILHCTCT